MPSLFCVRVDGRTRRTSYSIGLGNADAPVGTGTRIGGWQCPPPGGDHPEGRALECTVSVSLQKL